MILDFKKKIKKTVTYPCGTNVKFVSKSNITKFHVKDSNHHTVVGFIQYTLT